MASKSSIEMGRGHVTLHVDDSIFNRVIEASKAKLESLGRSAVAFGALLAGAGASITGVFMHGINVASEWSEEMIRAMRATGIGFGELDELMDGMRVNGEQFTALAARVSHAMHEAFTDPASEAAQRLGALGLTVADLQGMTLDQRIMSLADAIDRLPDAGERLNAMRTFFRNTGVRIEGGAAGIRERAARADQIEGVRTDADVRALDEYNEAMKELKLAASGFWLSLGTSAAPVMRDLLVQVTQIIVSTREWMDANRPLLTLVYQIGLGLVAAGTAITAFGGGLLAASTLIGFGTAALGVMWGWLQTIVLSPVMLVFRAGALASAAAMAVWSSAVAVGGAVIGGVMAIIKSGFGLLTLASLAWAATTTIASAVASAAMFAFNLILLPVGGTMGALKIASALWGVSMFAATTLVSAGMAAYKLMTLAATGATGGFTIGALAAKAATWLLNVALGVANVEEALLTFGTNLLIGSLAVLAFVAIPAVAAGLAGLFVGPIVAVGALAIAMTALGLHMTGGFDRIGDAGVRSAERSVSAWQTGRDAIVEGSRQVLDAWRGAFSEMVDSGVTAWQTIQSAMSRGDWEMVWATLRVFARIAWNEIKAGALLTWVELKHAALIVWDELSEAFVGGFVDAWTEIKIAFLDAYDWVRLNWGPVMVFVGESLITAFANALIDVEKLFLKTFKSIATMIVTALGQTVATRLGIDTSAIDRQIAELDRQGQQQGPQFQPGLMQQELRQEAIAEWFERQTEMVNREMERDALRTRERAAIEAGRMEEAGNLRAMLAALGEIDRERTDEAWYQDFLRQVEQYEKLPFASTGIRAFGNSLAVGSFDARTMFGALGASAARPRTEVLAEEQIKKAEMQIQLMQQFVREAREIARVAGARWG